MANNCLVTKLKESVQNDNLKKLGIYSFVQSAANLSLQMRAENSPSTVLNIYNNQTKELIDSVNLNNYTLVNYNFETESYCEIVNKYGLVILWPDQFDQKPTPEDFKYLTNLTLLSCWDFDDITDLGKLTKLVRLGLNIVPGRERGFLKNGEILDLVAAQKANNRNTCENLGINYGHLFKMTLNGHPTSSISVIAPDYRQVIKWTDTYVLVTNSEITNATKAMTYGMTDAEIAELKTQYPNITEVIKCD